LGGNAAHDVSVSVEIPGICIAGGCDPVGAEVLTLALIRIRNAGTSTAFLHACGLGVALQEQQLIDGSWINVGPAVACVIPSTPIQLAAGESLRFNRFYASGTRRLTLGVAGNLSLSDEALATSAAFVVR
jgi:hypothetical protein